jgi:hypothetical protein
MTNYTDNHNSPSKGTCDSSLYLSAVKYGLIILPVYQFAVVAVAAAAVVAAAVATAAVVCAAVVRAAVVTAAADVTTAAAVVVVVEVVSAAELVAVAGTAENFGGVALGTVNLAVAACLYQDSHLVVMDVEMYHLSLK